MNFLIVTVFIVLMFVARRYRSRRAAMVAWIPSFLFWMTVAALVLPHTHEKQMLGFVGEAIYECGKMIIWPLTAIALIFCAFSFPRGAGRYGRWAIVGGVAYLLVIGAAAIAWLPGMFEPS